MAKGYFSLVLHSHMPYIHHPENDDYIEERWLYEAISETYLPLLHVFDQLKRDSVPFRITMTLSPTLLSMLVKPEVKMRYNLHLDNLILLSQKEMVRTKKDDQLYNLASMYHERFSFLKRYYNDTLEGDIVAAFKKLQFEGTLEIITTAATHAFLPYMKTDQAVKAQIENAVILHEAVLGRAPKGIWLPECAYVDRLDPILKQYNLDYFFTDSHAFRLSSPQSQEGVYTPLKTRGGMIAFGRDELSARQVWSSKEGYPGDYDYREYYKDIGYELDEEYLKPHLHKSGVRLATGIKYWRVTGHQEVKELYCPEAARDKAFQHACHFVFQRLMQIQELYEKRNDAPLIVSTYDTELFGHWWFEGPIWIDSVFRILHKHQHDIGILSPADWINEKRRTFPDVHLPFTSWGEGGYGAVWLNDSNQWIYRHLHQMEERMIYLSSILNEPTDLQKRALNQAVRELLLAQSSDWAFILHNRTVEEYAHKRMMLHVERFHKLCQAVEDNEIDVSSLSHIEQLDDVFPYVDFRIFRSTVGNVMNSAHKPAIQGKILVLSWEFPPMTVGGLSRHVFDLSKHMVNQGLEIHVVTSHIEGYPSYECNQGIHVHRIPTLQAQERSFMEWVFQLNQSMVDYVDNLTDWFGDFDAIHAHDWLVGYAAKELKQRLVIPVVTTIHATEHGRNSGLYTALQQKIHGVEQNLVKQSESVIVCSNYMKKEVVSLFCLNEDDVVVISNGVDPAMVQAEKPDLEIRDQYALPEEKIVFFVGRLVQEKGIRTLLESVPYVREKCPDAKFVIAGKGPMLEELLNQAEALGIREHVLFCGFVDDQTRNTLFHFSSVAVFPSYYEPFGIVALEAMATGVPVVVSGVGGLGEIVEHEWDGYTVLPGNAHSLAEHIIRILQNQGEAEAMVENALYKVYTSFSWDTIAQQTIEVYNRVIMGDSSYSLIASAKE